MGRSEPKTVAMFVTMENFESRHMSMGEKYEFFCTMRDREFFPKTPGKRGGGGHKTKVKDDFLTLDDIAKILGVCHATVHRWYIIGREGITASKNRQKVRETAAPEVTEAMDRGDITTVDAVVIAELPLDEQVEALKDPKSLPTTRLLNTGNEEWYTPEKYINMARAVMNGIDLDPASCEFAQKVVQASKFYTKEDDGLEQQWSGRVWINPPYSKGLIDKFVEKVCAEYQLGDVDEAVVMVHNSADTEWFRKLGEVADRLCLTHGRISCYAEGEASNSPVSGHAFFYFGPNSGRFKNIFESIGTVWVKSI